MVTPNSRDRLFKHPNGEPKLTTRRPCLCCRKDFGSEGPGNRLCIDCRLKASDLSPYAP